MFAKYKTIALVVAVLGTASWAFYQHRSAVAEAVRQQEIIGRQNQQISSLRASQAALESARNSLQRQLAIREQQMRDAVEAMAEAERERDAIRTEAADRDAVLDDHDLTRLTNARPGMIEVRANEATQERFEEFEEVLR